jgi:polysaccharide biosynthesis transport protein
VEIDLRQLIRAALRWAWLIILVTLLVGAAAFVVGSRQTTTYKASTQVLINPEQSTTATEFSALQASRGQAETYRLLIQSNPVLDRVVETLDLPYGRSTLNGKISTTVLRDTQIIVIEVADPSPDQAALIANTLAEQFRAQVQDLILARYQTNLANLEQQTSDLESRRTEIDAQLAELESAGSTDNPADERQANDLNDERNRIAQTLADVDASVRAVNRLIATTNVPVEIASPAEVPSGQSGPKVLPGTIAGLVLGLILAAGIVALLEFLDKTIRQNDAIEELTGSPVLAPVANVKGLASNEKGIFTATPSGATAMEGVRMLRTSLLIAGSHDALRSITITSAEEMDGKSTIAGNLGVAMAQSGHKTVIIDADLRTPCQHELFGTSNEMGLTTLLAQSHMPWEQAAVETSVPGLTLLPSGPLRPNVADLLSSTQFNRLLEQMTRDVDLVVIDTPSVLEVSDALAVAAHTDGVILIARPGRTKSDSLSAAAQSVHQNGLRLVGVVMNRVKGSAHVAYKGAALSPAIAPSGEQVSENNQPQIAH